MERAIVIMFIMFQTITLFGDSMSKYISISDKIAIQYQTDAIKRCSDYALYKTISNTKDIKADYSAINAINIDPSENFELFREQYCMTVYDSYSQLTRRMFESKFICGILLTNDGYYVYDGDSKVSLKVPYQASRVLAEKIYRIYNPNTTRIMLLLDYSRWCRVDLNNGSQKIIQIPDDLLLYVNMSLSQCISKEINLRINNYFNTEKQYVINVPFFRTSEIAIAPIKGVSSIWVMATDNDTGDTPYIVVAGSEVEINQFCFGYTRNNIKYYTTFSNGHKLDDLGLAAEKLFRNARTAAEAGYHYDGWLSKKNN